MPLYLTPADLFTLRSLVRWSTAVLSICPRLILSMGENFRCWTVTWAEARVT